VVRAPRGAFLAGPAMKPVGDAEFDRAASARPVEGWPARHRALPAQVASRQDSEPQEADQSSDQHQADSRDEERNHQVDLLELPPDLRRESAVDSLQLPCRLGVGRGRLVRPSMSVLKKWIGFDEPASGWTSLALSSAGILALGLGVTLFTRGIPGSCRGSDGACLYLAGVYLSPVAAIGLIVFIVLAPFLFITGWRIGSRYTESSDSDHSHHVISLVPDGRTLGMIGLVTAALLVLAAAGLSIVFLLGLRGRIV